MAEIEFKRRGTPVWAVVLVLIVVAGVLYLVFGRGGGTTPVATAPDSTATTTATAAPPSAPPVAPVPAFETWARSSHAPTDAASAPRHVGEGLRLLTAALRERAPMAGVQHLLLAALADTVTMPSLTDAKRTDATQAAFFAAAYAVREQPKGPDLLTAASALQLGKPLREQAHAIDRFFEVAARVVADTTQGAPAGNR